jgi:hypothetical protein
VGGWVISDNASLLHLCIFAFDMDIYACSVYPPPSQGCTDLLTPMNIPSPKNHKNTVGRIKQYTPLASIKYWFCAHFAVHTIKETTPILLYYALAITKLLNSRHNNSILGILIVWEELYWLEVFKTSGWLWIVFWFHWCTVVELFCHIGVFGQLKVTLETKRRQIAYNDYRNARFTSKEV